MCSAFLVPSLGAKIAKDNQCFVGPRSPLLLHSSCIPAAWPRLPRSAFGVRIVYERWAHRLILCPVPLMKWSSFSADAHSGCTRLMAGWPERLPGDGRGGWQIIWPFLVFDQQKWRSLPGNDKWGPPFTFSCPLGSVTSKEIQIRCSTGRCGVSRPVWAGMIGLPKPNPCLEKRVSQTKMRIQIYIWIGNGPKFLVKPVQPARTVWIHSDIKAVILWIPFHFRKGLLDLHSVEIPVSSMEMTPLNDLCYCGSVR